MGADRDRIYKLEVEVARLTTLLARAKTALEMANIVDCSPCPENSPTPIEECMECAWGRFTANLLHELEKGPQ